MSWLSNFEHSVLDAVAGKPAGPIIVNPKTPLETAVNSVGSAGASAVSSTTSVVKQEAASTVQGYLTNSVGNVGSELIESALEGLAATAISKMSASSNKTEAEVAALLGKFLQTLSAPAPAVA